MKWLSDTVLDHVARVADEPDLSATKYRLVELLGRGGMGAVYAVHDAELDREVALKVCADDAEAEVLAARLRREARIVAKLEHPGIVPVHDVGMLADGRVYYVMKRVKGQRLDEWLRRSPPLSASLRLFQRVCEAVAFAHAHGVIHRDLKPENVMVGEFGEALVMDWGIAKELGEDTALATHAKRAGEAHVDAYARTLRAPEDDRTIEGTVMGTPAYMSPEQAEGRIDAIDARSDVYGLGAILHFLLTGAAPVEAAPSADLLDAVARGAIRPVRERNAEIPKPLASICHKALSRERRDRYPEALAMSEDVGHFLDGLPVSAHRDTMGERAARFVSRHRVVLSLLGVYLLVRVVMALMAR